MYCIAFYERCVWCFEGLIGDKMKVEITSPPPGNEEKMAGKKASFHNIYGPSCVCLWQTSRMP